SVVSFLGGANVSLRGVGTGQNVGGTDESVGVYLDDIYQGITSSAFTRFFDLERTEVLKGPQGTLYGRNVTAGALNLVSRAPELGSFSGQAEAVYGTYDALRANAALNLPVGEDAALRLSGTFGSSRGFVQNIDTGEYLNGDDYFGLRARFLFEPSDRLTIDAGIQYVQDDTASVWEPLDSEAGWLGYGKVRVPKALNFANDETLNANLRVTLGLSDTLSLRSITGYFTQEGDHSVSGPGNIPDPLDGAYQLDQTSYDQFSQEVQLQWEMGGNSAVIGAYYLDSEATGQRRIDFNLFGLPNFQNAVNRDTTEAFALFGEAQIAVTDQLKLIAGLRYNDEKRGLRVSAGDPPGLTDPATPFSDTASFDAVSGRAGLTYEISDETLAYLTISKGFKSGGVQNIDGVIGHFRPEILWAYEAGVKHALPRGGALEVAAFQYDYQDIQVFQVVNVFDFQVVNAAEARIRGVDASARLRAGENFGLNLSGTYLDATYRDFIYRGPGGVDFDLAGERLARAPEFTFATQFVVDNWTVFERWTGNANLEVNHRPSQLTTVGDPAAMAAASLEGVTLVNFGFELRPVEDTGFGIFGNVRNIGDVRYYEFSGGGGIIGGVVAPGRRFEVGVRASF
ncbi:MAG: TonB-dependent receptor, partial [Erythrobacter sp.]|uniref:TonB-dependent receptor n=1 Tax=Erythrobacter sp. TaxID=1042 RepID=UPI0025CD1493